MSYTFRISNRWACPRAGTSPPSGTGTSSVRSVGTSPPPSGTTATYYVIHLYKNYVRAIVEFYAGRRVKLLLPIYTGSVRYDQLRSARDQIHYFLLQDSPSAVYYTNMDSHYCTKPLHIFYVIFALDGAPEATGIRKDNLQQSPKHNLQARMLKDNLQGQPACNRTALYVPLQCVMSCTHVVSTLDYWTCYW